ncbi:hypothetical protein ScPMuIL_001431 [Solemya velum]
MSADDVTEEYLNAAISIARQSGVLVQEAFHKEKLIETKQSFADLVTQTDEAVENLIHSFFMDKFPEHKFIGEETVAKGEKCELTDAPTWIIDPVDGTTNFVHRIPEVCISIGLTINKEMEVGVIYLPMLDRMYTTRKGHGAFCNGEKLSVQKAESLNTSIVIVESGSDRNQDVIKRKMENTRKIVTNSRGIRSYGSAAFNLCRVAEGCAEAYIEYSLHIWDIAAGALLVREAGGIAIDPEGGDLDLRSRRILCASTEKIALELSQILDHLQFERD